MKFLYFRKFWVTDLGWPDISFGIHICMKGRVDLHLLKWMFSFGKVPIYRNKIGRTFAASNSFHENQASELRAGNPSHHPTK